MLVLVGAPDAAGDLEEGAAQGLDPVGAEEEGGAAGGALAGAVVVVVGGPVGGGGDGVDGELHGHVPRAARAVDVRVDPGPAGASPDGGGGGERRRRLPQPRDGPEHGDGGRARWWRW